jgi:hypothetical protein
VACKAPCPAGQSALHLLSLLEECDARDRKECRERADLTPRNTSERFVMSDTAFGRRANTRLPVCEPFSGMAVERPAAGVGNGDGDHTRTAGKDAVTGGAEGTDPATVPYLGGGRSDGVYVERGRRWQQSLVRVGEEVQQQQAPVGEWVKDEHCQHHAQEQGC